MTSFPPRNLPADAEDWGRAAERRIESSESLLESFNRSVNNSSRFTGGQLSVFGGQVDEQLARTTLLASPADLSVTGNATSEPFPRASRSVSFPNPGGARAAQLEVYVHHDYSASATVYVYVTYQGGIVSKLMWMQETDEAGFTFENPRRGYGLANISLPASGPVDFDITLVRVGFTSATTTETLSDIRVYLTPFQATI